MLAGKKLRFEEIFSHLKIKFNQEFEITAIVIPQYLGA